MTVCLINQAYIVNVNICLVVLFKLSRLYLLDRAESVLSNNCHILDSIHKSIHHLFIKRCFQYKEDSRLSYSTLPHGDEREEIIHTWTILDGSDTKKLRL